MSEQRQHPRTHVSVDLVFHAVGAETIYSGTGTDLSIGGMFVATRTRLGIGTRVKVRMRPSLGHDEINAEATIRWENGAGFGLQFSPLSAKETHILTEYLRSKAAAHK